MEPRKLWSTSHQFNSNFTATNITKYQYGFETSDLLYLTETESYLTALALLKEIPLYNDNTKLEYVSASDRYVFGQAIDKNVMESELYLRHFNYLDFYYGYTGYNEHKFEEINKDYTSFFVSIDMKAPNNASESLIGGYEAYMKAYNYKIK